METFLAVLGGYTAASALNVWVIVGALAAVFIGMNRWGGIPIVVLSVAVFTIRMLTFGNQAAGLGQARVEMLAPIAGMAATLWTVFGYLVGRAVRWAMKRMST